MADQNPLDTTLREARTYLNTQLYKGTKCPCCTQFAKIYKRPIHATMTRMLINLFHLGQGYHHIREFVVGTTGTNDFSKFVYWGLVEELKDEGVKDGRTNGYWKITSKGIQFILREIAVPHYAEVYDGRCIQLSGEDTYVDQTLSKKFNYHELMTI